MSNGALRLLAGAGAGDDPVYVDDVFNTFIDYSGGFGPHTAVTGLDMSGEGGMVWTKARDGATNHWLYDTVRGATEALSPDQTAAEATVTYGLTGFTSTGFTFSISHAPDPNSQVWWSWRKAEGFFDVVTYTGDGNSGRTVSHNLGSVPGMIIIKRTDATSNWPVYHRSLTSGHSLYLNLNSASASYSGIGFSNVTSTSFDVGNDTEINASGGTYVAYIYAHDAQDFGTNSDESIIKCGSYTTDSSGDASIDLGFEPQFIFAKRATGGTGDWFINDVMRGIVTGGNDPYLVPNSAAAENSSYNYYDLTPTGFKHDGGFTSSTYIYMAIRRPHKPASEFAATDLFSMDAAGSTSSNPCFVSNNHIVDMAWEKQEEATTDALIFSRLTGSKYLNTTDTSSESTGSSITWDYMSGCLDGFGGADTYQSWMFRRAPGFFDVVAYTGQSAEMSVSHNLGVTPELIIQKCRTQGSGYNWNSWFTGLTNSQYINLNSDAAVATSSNLWGTNATVATDSVFRVGAGGTGVNGGASETHIAYLFATTAGISKVGTYSGTGSAQDIDCGFSSGARFILIKRTDTAVYGTHWLYWDTVRGITSGNDPYLFLDLGAAQNSSGDYIDPLSSGFTITSDAPAFMNASGGTYLFLAIA